MAGNNPFSLLRLYIRSKAALYYARRYKIPGLEFAYYGQHVGWRLLLSRIQGGVNLLLNPVNITRYFEFPFVFSCLAETRDSCLDVSSPRLFSLYVADKFPQKSIRIINPDSTDIEQTARTIDALRLKQIQVECTAAESLLTAANSYDCIWSISVIEHIAGKYDDTYAVQLMYNALNRGGRLILTFPVDRNHWDEHRDTDPYGSQNLEASGKYFFQRFYDKESIRTRILDPIGQQPKVVQWFGEVVPGTFHRYIQRWLHYGREVTVNDPREVADCYRVFSSWDEMPGVGVCGLMIEKN